MCLGVGGVAGLHFTLQAQYFVDRALSGIALFGGRDNGFVMLWMRCGTYPSDKGFLCGSIRDGWDCTQCFFRVRHRISFRGGVLRHLPLLSRFFCGMQSERVVGYCL